MGISPPIPHSVYLDNAYFLYILQLIQTLDVFFRLLMSIVFGCS